MESKSWNERTASHEIDLESAQFRIFLRLNAPVDPAFHWCAFQWNSIESTSTDCGWFFFPPVRITCVHPQRIRGSVWSLPVRRNARSKSSSPEMQPWVNPVSSRGYTTEFSCRTSPQLLVLVVMNTNLHNSMDCSAVKTWAANQQSC